MARLVYTSIASLDGYIADTDGDFGWAEPDAEVHAFVNDLERPIGTYLYGRRTYEVMTSWETITADDVPAPDPVELDYAELWRRADKVVYSTSLASVSTTRTRLERTFDADAVRSLVAGSESDVGLGGAMIAGQAMRAGLVEEYNLLTFPVVVGGGTPAFPADVRVGLRLLESRTFDSGVVYSRYAVR